MTRPYVGRSAAVACGVLIMLTLQPAAGLAQVVAATETARGEFENGVFTPGKPEFGYRFRVDEAARTVTLVDVVRLRDGSVMQDGTEYVITATDDGTSMSQTFLVPEGRRGQRVLTLVGKPGALATEVILLGETFFEYCKASSGRLYVASGHVRRPR